MQVTLDFKRVIFGLLVVCFATCCLFAQGRRVTIEDVITLPQKDLPPATASIAGTVVSEATARPVVGATVTLTRHFDRPLLALLLQGDSAAAFKPILTDDQGRFTFNGLLEGDYGFIVQKDGYLLRKLGESNEEGRLTKVTVATGQAIEGFQIAITPSARIRGHVRNESGQLLANFPIRLFQTNNIQAVAAETVSAPDGSFELLNFLPGAFVLVAGSSLKDEPLGSFAATVVAPTAEAVSQDVTLSTGRYVIRGKVTVKDARPPANALVDVNSAPRAGLRVGDRIEATLEYDATSGNFGIPSLASGFYRLDASLPDAPFCGSINVVVSSRSVSDVPFALTQCLPGN